jgi:pilus assembly protein TadC
MTVDLLFPAFVILALGVCGYLAFRGVLRQRSTQLVDATLGADESRGVPASIGSEGPLIRWLGHAGFRHSSASIFFVAAMVGAIGAGLAGFYIMKRSGVIEWMASALVNIPGGVGDALQATVLLAPWIVFLISAAAPLLFVRAARRRKVEQIEQDLPLLLDLLATLAQAGMGFDAAIARVLESENAPRPLNAELRVYQRDTLAGISRTQALRNLAQRLEVTSVTVFISALVQAEQVGAALSETLSRQAEDLRERRKLQALLLAQALPAKLVFPLVACFLPGIFVTTLGPTLNQLINVADSVLRNMR